MKSFAELTASLTEGKSYVFDKKMSNVKVQIAKEGSKFVVYLDGDKLDAYKSQKEAEAMATDFIKQYKR